MLVEAEEEVQTWVVPHVMVVIFLAAVELFNGEQETKVEVERMITRVNTSRPYERKGDSMKAHVVIVIVREE